MTMPNFSPRILQLHPTRACNLRCLHCYSSSAPSEQYQQDPTLLVRAIGDAATLGYRVLSISGGEPLLYSGLPSLLTEARRQGMQATITTNGLLLDDRHIQVLEGWVDLVAISLDGTGERHNLMRNAPRAFETMCRRLESLRSSGITFGFLFTLTHDNLEDLSWAAEFAAEQGAKLLQVHPLEEVGRAQSQLKGQRPTDIDATLAWLLMGRLRRKFSDRLTIHLDFLDRDLWRKFSYRQRLAVTSSDDCPYAAELADLISPLVVETDSTVVPLQYGFPRGFALGNLSDASMIEIARTWFSRGRLRWEALCDDASSLLCQPADLPFVNWYESLASLARASNLSPFAVVEAV
jgi:MoaA/NifB/PqqE/SkfB family radical SAM enzyme